MVLFSPCVGKVLKLVLPVNLTNAIYVMDEVIKIKCISLIYTSFVYIINIHVFKCANVNNDRWLLACIDEIKLCFK